MRPEAIFFTFSKNYVRIWDAQEELLFQREADTLLDNAEKASVMELTTSWMEKGIEIGRQERRQEGRQEGRREGRQEGRERECQLVLRRLRKRWGQVDTESEARIRQFSFDQLERLGEASLDFTSIADLKDWLAAP